MSPYLHIDTGTRRISSFYCFVFNLIAMATDSWMETFGGAERDKLRMPPHVTLDTLDGHSLPFVWFFSLKAFFGFPGFPNCLSFHCIGFSSVVEVFLNCCCCPFSLPSSCSYFLYSISSIQKKSITKKNLLLYHGCGDFVFFFGCLILHVKYSFVSSSTS